MRAGRLPRRKWAVGKRDAFVGVTWRGHSAVAADAAVSAGVGSGAGVSDGALTRPGTDGRTD